MTNGNGTDTPPLAPSVAESLSTVGYGLFAFLSQGPLSDIPSLAQFADTWLATDAAARGTNTSNAPAAQFDQAEHAEVGTSAETTPTGTHETAPEDWAAYEASLQAAAATFNDTAIPGITADPEPIQVEADAAVDRNPAIDGHTINDPDTIVEYVPATGTTFWHNDRRDPADSPTDAPTAIIVDTTLDAQPDQTAIDDETASLLQEIDFLDE